MKKLLFTALLTAFTTTAFAESNIQSQIFDQSFEVATLSTQEMEATEGAYSFGTLAQGMLAGAAFNATVGNLQHYARYGELASPTSTAVSAGIGAMTGGMLGHAAAATGQSLKTVLTTPLVGGEQYFAAKLEVIMASAQFPYSNSNKDLDLSRIIY